MSDGCAGLDHDDPERQIVVLCLTGLTAMVAIAWMAHRRLLKLGLRLLAAGIAVNTGWEAILFTVWDWRYETEVPKLLQAGYQSLTEFGPLLVSLNPFAFQSQILSHPVQRILSVLNWRLIVFHRRLRRLVA